MKNNESDEETEDIDKLVAELKDSANRYAAENTRLKQELETTQQNLAAQENILLSEAKAEDTNYSEENFEKNKKELQYLIHAFGLKIDNEKEYLRETLNGEVEKGKSFSSLVVILSVAYYIMRAKIFETVAQNSLKQQSTMHNFLKLEKEDLVKNYEKTIDRLKQRLDEKKAIAKENAANQTRGQDLIKLQKEVQLWKTKAHKYQTCL